MTELVPPAGAGWVDDWLTGCVAGWLADSSTDMLGFEPPLPLTGTVVVTGLTVVVVVAAAGAVVGVVAGADATGAAAVLPLATVVETGTLPAVP